MSAPKVATHDARSTPYYSSPHVVPDAWSPERPGVVEGLQPTGAGMGNQGPDQGYALTIAKRLAPQLRISDGEQLDDAIRAGVVIALRRASLFSRAPVVHDLNIAFTMWGLFDENPPPELVARRAELFEGVGDVNHHYAEGRAIADLVDESTLRMTPEAVAAAYPAQWRELTGA